MWIIPRNHPELSRFAQESVESKEELSKLLVHYESWPMWRSKPSSLKTWCVRWKRVPWLQRLFGRMLEPSHRISFEAVLTGLWVDTPARENHLPEKENSKIMLDTFGRLYEKVFAQLNLWDFSSKMSTTTSQELSNTYLMTYTKWVTQLRQEYSQRKKLARHMRDSEYSSSLFTTPVATDSVRLQVKWATPTTNRSTRASEGYGQNLIQQVKWSTPQNRDYRSPDLNGSGNMERKRLQGWTEDLNSQVVNLGTPTTRDWKDGTAQSVKNVPHNGLLGRMDHSPEFVNGQQPQGKISLNGNIQELSRERLNPLWVCQLMGFDFEKTFFVHLEMPVFPIKPS